MDEHSGAELLLEPGSLDTEGIDSETGTEIGSPSVVTGSYIIFAAVLSNRKQSVSTNYIFRIKSSKTRRFSTP